MNINLKPMTPSDFETYLDFSTPTYAAEKVRAGNWPEQDAAELARAEFKQLFPEGLATPNQHIFCIQDDAVEIGYLWIAERTQGNKKFVWIFDIVIFETHRRKGYATATFTALEKFVKEELDGNRIELHVFGHNHGARTLYEKLGFEVINVVMAKDLSTE